MIKITYPGTNNYSTFAFDALGRNVSIVETVSGSVTSTKQFLWSADDIRPYQPCEARNSGGTITAQYFPLGQALSGTIYLYTTDHLGLSDAGFKPFSQLNLIGRAHPAECNPVAHAGSMREMTNSSGVIQDQRMYDPFGRSVQLQGTLVSDFQYAAYYAHAPSGLCLSAARSYNTQQGRFVSRDPIGEFSDNMYEYAVNQPTGSTDASGLRPSTIQGTSGAGGAGGWNAQNYITDLCSCKTKCGKKFKTSDERYDGCVKRCMWNNGHFGNSGTGSGPDWPYYPSPPTGPDPDKDPHDPGVPEA
jgi:RHS repeat-associated protein